MKYKCEACKGRGYNSAKRPGKSFVLCKECNGKGKIDWIDNVFGVEKTLDEYEWWGTSVFSPKFLEEVKQKLTEEIAKVIDKYIISSFYK